MYFCLIGKTKYLKRVWIKSFKNKEDMNKWLVNSVVHSENDLYKIMKLGHGVVASPGCSFLDTHYFEEGDFSMPIKEFFKMLKEESSKFIEDSDALLECINNSFQQHSKVDITPIQCISISKDNIDTMNDIDRRDFYKSIHRSSV